MATWTIQVSAQSGQGDGASGTHATTLGQALPGDFDGATINSVTLSGAGSTTVSGASDDTVGVRIIIETTGGTDIYGNVGSDAGSLAFAAASTSGSAITAGSSPSPAPTTAVAADWDNVLWSVVYNRTGKADGATIAWSQFNIVVDYTPDTTITETVTQASETDTAQPITIDPQHRLVTQATETDTAQPITAVLGPRVWLNTVANGPTLTGATQMTVTAWSLDGTSVTFSDPIGAPTGSNLWLGVENNNRGEANTGWTQVTVNVGGLSATVNQASETDTAQPITVDPQHRLVGQATETDTAQPITAVLGPKAWLNTVANGPTLTGATQMTVTAWTLDGTSVTFDDPIGAPIGSNLWFGIENVNAGGGEANTGWIQVTVNASGFTVTVNQASETDTAQAIALELRRLVGQATETDTAQPITVNPQHRLVNQASETDTAQPITSATRRLVGQVSETDTAQPVTLELRRLVGQATETDIAQPISAPGNIIVPVNQASETDTAQPITVDPQHRLVGLVTETDVAQPFTVLKTRAIGQATETDTAQAMTGYLGPKAWLNTVANGPTLTGATQMTVTAWSLDGTSVSFTDPIGAPIGSNLWFGIENVNAGGGEANTGWIQVTVNASGFQVTVNQATETDTAQPITLELRRLVTQATETDTAQPFTVLKTRSVGQATETDTAQPIIQPAGQVIPVGQAIETDTAQPITWEVRRLVGLASETDFALPITVVGGVADVAQGGGSGGHGAVILPPRPYKDAVPEAPPGVSVDEMLAVLAVVDLDQNGYD